MTKRYRLTLSGMYKDDDGDWVKYEEVAKLEAVRDAAQAIRYGFIWGCSCESCAQAELLQIALANSEVET